MKNDSDYARAVAKGMKNKEVSDIGYKFGLFIAIFLGVIFGIAFNSIIVGAATWIIISVIAFKNWYKE